MKKTDRVAGAFLLAIPLAAPLAATPEDQAPSEPIDAKTMPVMNGQNLQRAAGSGEASFIISLADLNIFEKWSLLKAKQMAVVFSGDGHAPGRACPVFNLHAHPYKIEEIKPDVFRVSTRAGAGDFKAVEESGCLISSPPDRHKIKYLPRNTPAGA